MGFTAIGGWGFKCVGFPLCIKTSILIGSAISQPLITYFLRSSETNRITCGQPALAGSLLLSPFPPPDDSTPTAETNAVPPAQPHP